MQSILEKFVRQIDNFSIRKKMIFIYIFCMLLPITLTDGVIIYTVLHTEAQLRRSEMEDIADAWRSYSLGKEGIMEAELHYVTMPGAAQIAGMKQFLCRIYHKKDITLKLVMQPDLIGGFVLKAGDIEYDYSLKGQLSKLRRAVVR